MAVSFIGGRNRNTHDNTTDLSQITDELYRVHIAMRRIQKHYQTIQWLNYTRLNIKINIRIIECLQGVVYTMIIIHSKEFWGGTLKCLPISTIDFRWTFNKNEIDIYCSSWIKMELTWQLCSVWRQWEKSVKWHINIPQYMFYIESFPLINLQEAKNITHISDL